MTEQFVGCTDGYQASITHITTPINLMTSLDFIEDELDKSDGDGMDVESGGLESVCKDFECPMTGEQMADFLSRIDAIKNLTAKELADWDASVVKGAKLGQIIPPPGYVPSVQEPVQNAVVRVDDPEPTDEELAKIEAAMNRHIRFAMKKKGE